MHLIMTMLCNYEYAMYLCLCYVIMTMLCNYVYAM